jgi:hypothetical protein
MLLHRHLLSLEKLLPHRTSVAQTALRRFRDVPVRRVRVSWPRRFPSLAVHIPPRARQQFRAEAWPDSPAQVRAKPESRQPGQGSLMLRRWVVRRLPVSTARRWVQPRPYLDLPRWIQRRRLSPGTAQTASLEARGAVDGDKKTLLSRTAPGRRPLRAGSGPASLPISGRPSWLVSPASRGAHPISLERLRVVSPGQVGWKGSTRQAVSLPPRRGLPVLVQRALRSLPVPEAAFPDPARPVSGPLV